MAWVLEVHMIDVGQGDSTLTVALSYTKTGLQGLTWGFKLLFDTH